MTPDDQRRRLRNMGLAAMGIAFAIGTFVGSLFAQLVC